MHLSSSVNAEIAANFIPENSMHLQTDVNYSYAILLPISGYISWLLTQKQAWQSHVAGISSVQVKIERESGKGDVTWVSSL